MKILDRYFNDRSQRIRMLCESVIKGTRSIKTFKWLLKYQMVCPSHERIKILRILTGFRESKTLIRMFKKIFLEEKEESVRITALESIGRHKTKESIEFLMKIIREGEIFSLIACESFAHMLALEDLDKVGDILALDPDKNSDALQVILNFILKIPRRITFPESIEEKILELTEARSVEVRYLAVRCLSKTHLIEKIFQLISISKLDTEPYVRKAAARSIIEIINEQPEEQMPILFMCFESRCMYFTLNRILKNIKPVETDFFKVIKLVLRLICGEVSVGQQDISMKSLRLMAFIRSQANMNKTLFLKCLNKEIKDDKELWVMLKVLNLTDIGSLAGVNVDFLVTKYPETSQRTRVELLEFFSRLKAGRGKIEKIVFREYAIEKDKVVALKLGEVIRIWARDTIVVGS
jgi:hypothetical protein